MMDWDKAITITAIWAMIGACGLVAGPFVAVPAMVGLLATVAILEHP